MTSDVTARPRDDGARRRPRPPHRRQLQCRESRSRRQRGEVRPARRRTSSSTCPRPTSSAVQEIQDANGLNGTDPLSGEVTAQMLIDAIAAHRRPAIRLCRDRAVERRARPAASPAATSATAIFYNPDRVAYVAGSAELIDRSRVQRQPQAAGRRLHLQRRDGDPDQRPLHLAARQRPALGREPAAGRRRRRRAHRAGDRGQRLCQRRAGRRSGAQLRRARRFQRLLFRGCDRPRSRPAACSPTCIACSPRRSAIPICSTAISQAIDHIARHRRAARRRRVRRGPHQRRADRPTPTGHRPRPDHRAASSSSIPTRRRSTSSSTTTRSTRTRRPAPWSERSAPTIPTATCWHTRWSTMPAAGSRSTRRPAR